MKASRRLQIGPAIMAGFAFLAIALGIAAPTRADIVASFSSATSKDYSYTGGATSTFVDVPNTASPGGAAPAGNGLAGYIQFGSGITVSVDGPIHAVIYLSASSGSAASGSTQDGFGGTYSIYSLVAVPANGSAPAITKGELLLNNVFTNAELRVPADGTATLSSVAATTVTLTTPFATITPPESFSLTLSGVPAGAATIHKVGGVNVFTNFKGNDVITNSGTIVPEPSTMALAGLGALGLIGYGLRRRKAMVA